jgi:uncharacterized iron-regulated membrane protein
MSKSRFGILLYRWHAWVGLISGVFLLIICVTGSVAVFRPEIERAIDWKGYDFNVEAGGRTPITLERAIATAEAAYPGSIAQIARYPDIGGSWQSHGDTYSIQLNRGQGKGTLTVLVDPYDNKVVAAMRPNRGWGDWLRQLHVRFLYGSYWGRWIVGVFGLVLVFSIVSGLMIYRKFNGGSWMPMLRRGRGARIFLADLHKIVGLGSVAFNIVFGLSGAVIGLEGLYRKYMMAPASSVITRMEGIKTLAPGVIEHCVDQSRKLIPGGTPTSVTLTHAKTGMIRVHVETPIASLVKENASSVLFSATTGEPVEVYDARNASLAGRFYYAMEPLHFGRLGGAMWVKLLWGLMGLTGGLLSVTGFAIFILRKRKPATRRIRAPEHAGVGGTTPELGLGAAKTSA